MMIAGVLIGAETSAMPDELAVEQDYGWMLVLLGALVSLAAMVLPVWRSRRIKRDGVVPPTETMLTPGVDPRVVIEGPTM